MAAYQPPTEILPKFNEFVFNQANSPEYLDQLVVHKAGTETITGNKTFKGTITATNTTTSLTATTKNELQSFTGLNSLMNTSGINSMTTFSGSNQMVNNTGFNIITNDTGSNFITTADGDNTIESTNGNNITQVLDGSNQFNAIGSGSNLLTTDTGINSIISNTGQIKLQTGASGNEGILIENTSTGAGGITLRTNGTSGDIVLSAVDDINLTTTGTSGVLTLKATNSDVNISSGSGLGNEIQLINGTTTKMTITSTEVNVNANLGAPFYYTGIGGAISKPLISFCITLYPQDYNTTNSQLLLGYPNADTTNVVRRLRFPHQVKCVGWSVCGDADAHSAATLQVIVSTGLNGTGTIHYTQSGVLAANALQSNCGSCDLTDTVGGAFSSATVATSNLITAGATVYFYESTGAVNFLNEMIFVFFFQQTSSL